MQLKRNTFLILFHLFGFLSLATLACKGQALNVSDLMCEYRVDPVGIGDLHPKLSWVIRSNKHGVRQLAYQVIVADHMQIISKGKGNIWDSGKMESGESIQVIYNGPSLQPGKKYFWRVRIWDNAGAISAWSAPASWRVGLQTIPDWHNAHWIAYDEPAATQLIVPAAHGGGEAQWGKMHDTLPLLRKEFVVRKRVAAATMFISGLGHFELEINGRKASDDFLDPGWTQYSKHALYVGFDVTKMLKKESNVIGVMLGNGFYHVPAERYRKVTGSFGHPKMICRLLLEYDDGSVESIVSDSTWKVAAGPVTFSSIYGGEDYDARLEQEGWAMTGFDDSLWRPAIVVKGPPAVDASVTEPLNVMQEFAPVSVAEPTPGVYVYDLGQNFSGIPSITVRGNRGEKVRIIPGEILDSNGLVSQRPSGGPMYFEYVLKGDGPETWQPRFMYYGFRYLQVEGAIRGSKAAGKPVMVKITGLHTRQSARSTGSFTCSNKLFNDIFHLIDWSIKSNMASVLTDCPHREKLGWLEVPHLLGNSIRYNYDIASLYRKIIVDMKMSQTDSGLVPNIAPEWVQFDTDFRDSPEWGSSCVILPYNLYQWYGDREALATSYDMMKRYVDYLGAKADNHIVSYGLGDWFDIGPNGSGSGYSVSTPRGITGTAIYYLDLDILIKTASLLGKTDDAVRYQRIAEQVKKAFNNKFYNAETAQYGTGSQTANAMAVYMNLVSPENKKAVVENICKNIRARDNRLSSGEVGYKYLLAVLEAENKSDIIYDMNSRSDVPGYGYQIAHGATTLMEDWQAIKTLGNNHCMLGHLLGWLYSGVAGIRQQDSSQAFKNIIIAPEPVGDISFASASYLSPYGTIVSEWKKEGNSFSLRTEIPANTDAVIYLPGNEHSLVNVDGKQLQQNQMRYENGKIVVNLGSGSYRLKVINNH